MGVPTTKAGEIRPYRAGRCVSHGSLGFSISFPDTGLCQGESEKELSLLLLHRQSSHCGGKTQKGQITFLANVWTRVKVGQRGNFSIISTESTLFSVKGEVQQGRPPDVTLPARTAPEGQLIPLSAASLISHLLMAGRNRLHSGLRRPPGASRGYPSQTLGVNAKTPER